MPPIIASLPPRMVPASNIVPYSLSGETSMPLPPPSPPRMLPSTLTYKSPPRWLTETPVAPSPPVISQSPSISSVPPPTRDRPL
ncbi:MAG: hypothetical protein ACLVB5_05225 [Christensenellales bacterium]